MFIKIYMRTWKIVPRQLGEKKTGRMWEKEGEKEGERNKEKWPVLEKLLLHLWFAMRTDVSRFSPKEKNEELRRKIHLMNKFCSNIYIWMTKEKGYSVFFIEPFAFNIRFFFGSLFMCHIENARSYIINKNNEYVEMIFSFFIIVIWHHPINLLFKQTRKPRELKTTQTEWGREKSHLAFNFEWKIVFECCDVLIILHTSIACR